MATSEVPRQKQPLPFVTSYRMYVEHSDENKDRALRSWRTLRVGGGILAGLGGIFLAPTTWPWAGIAVLVMLMLIPRIRLVACVVLCIVAAHFVPLLAHTAGMALGVFGLIWAILLAIFYFEVKNHPSKIGF